MAQTGCVELEEPLGLLLPSFDDVDCRPTVQAESTVLLKLDDEAYRKIQNTRPDLWTLALTLPDGTHEWVEMHRFKVHNPDFEIGHMTSEGLKVERYAPQLLTYRLGTAGFHGTFVIMADEIAGTLRHDGIQYELGGLECDGSDTGYYALYTIADAINPPAFDCGMEDIERRLNNPKHDQTPAMRSE